MAKPPPSVFGQPDFVTITASGKAIGELYSPHHIATDTNGQVYVTDSGNNRVQIFGDPNNPLTSANPILTLFNLSTPQGIFVNQSTGEIWVTTGSTATRYPKYDTLQLNPAPTGTVQAASTTLAVAQDQYGDMFLADATSRVAVYYQGLVARMPRPPIRASRSRPASSPACIRGFASTRPSSQPLRYPRRRAISR